jgi:hypothetical protein
VRVEQRKREDTGLIGGDDVLPDGSVLSGAPAEEGSTRETATTSATRRFPTQEKIDRGFDSRSGMDMTIAAASETEPAMP